MEVRDPAMQDAAQEPGQDSVAPDDLPLVCTVLPTYNERENIGPLIEGVLAAADHHHTARHHVDSQHMVLVVDDNSPDGTWEVVEAMMARYNIGEHGTDDPAARPRVALCRRMDESGLTSAIQQGIDLAIQQYGAQIVTWMDCDLSMPPADVPRLVQTVRDGADIAAGSRWIDGGADVAHGPMARTLSWLINRLAMLLIGSDVHDYTSGFIAARAVVLRQLRLRGDYGEYCIDLLGRALNTGRRVVEVPYICVPRTSGESKTGVNLWDYLLKGRKYVATIWRVRRV